MQTQNIANLDDRSRVDSLAEAFHRRFPDRSPEVVVRVPGRVNLIGEHIDYCGYAVHPMAIDQDILVAVARNSERKLRLR